MEVDTDWSQVIPYAHSKGVGAAIYSPLAGGLLTDSALMGGAPHPLSGAAQRGGGRMSDQRQRQVDKAARLRFLSEGQEQSLAQAAVRFILMQPGVTTVLGGFSDTEQLEEVADASGKGPLTGEQMARVQKVWQTNFSA